MNQAVTSPHPLSAFERMRHWWGRVAATVFPGAGGDETSRATARIIASLQPLLEQSRTQSGGEV